MIDAKDIAEKAINAFITGLEKRGHARCFEDTSGDFIDAEAAANEAVAEVVAEADEDKREPLVWRSYAPDGWITEDGKLTVVRNVGAPGTPWTLRLRQFDAWLPVASFRLLQFAKKYGNEIRDADEHSF